MENGNLLAPKNNNRSCTCFPVPNLDNKLTTHRFGQEMLADAGRGSAGAHRLPPPAGAAWGWLCVHPNFCAGDLKIFRVMGNFALEKIAVICIFGQGATRNEFGLMRAKPSLSILVEEMWELRGKDQGAAENVLQ